MRDVVRTLAITSRQVPVVGRPYAEYRDALLQLGERLADGG